MTDQNPPRKEGGAVPPDVVEPRAAQPQTPAQPTRADILAEQLEQLTQQAEILVEQLTNNLAKSNKAEGLVEKLNTKIIAIDQHEKTKFASWDESVKEKLEGWEVTKKQEIDKFINDYNLRNFTIEKEANSKNKEHQNIFTNTISNIGIKHNQLENQFNEKIDNINEQAKILIAKSNDKISELIASYKDSLLKHDASIKQQKKNIKDQVNAVEEEMKNLSEKINREINTLSNETEQIKNSTDASLRDFKDSKIRTNGEMQRALASFRHYENQAELLLGNIKDLQSTASSIHIARIFRDAKFQYGEEVKPKSETK